MTAVCRPFLKWAGGKSKLAPLVVDRAPEFATYHEPFLGGGAVFFALANARPGTAARLSDGNQELIECYGVVRDVLDALCANLLRLEACYLSGDAQGRLEFYLAQRASEPCTSLERAARLIFLNKTCFNGLYRVNREGRFNVPHGRYRNPRIFDEHTLTSAAVALATAQLASGDFQQACAAARPDDFVYLDPPYVPLSATSSFTHYTADDFGPADQERLATAFHDLTQRGVSAMLSNSDHEAVRALYEGRGYRFDHVPMARSINSKGTGRSPIPELLIDNFERVGAA